MACFIAPAVEAAAVTIVYAAMKKKEKTAQCSQTAPQEPAFPPHIPFLQKLSWLLKLLWGGCFLLCVEHIWHGEVVPWWPFLTAMNDPAETQIMLSELASVGVSMAILITLVWCVMLAVSSRHEKACSVPARRRRVKLCVF